MNPLLEIHPQLKSSPAIRTPAQIGIPYIAPLLRTPDGVHLSCYLLPQTTSSLTNPQRRKSVGRRSRARSSRGIEDERVEITLAAEEAAATVLVFHGNAAHNWEDMESAQDFFRMGCNVFLASYRGYVFCFFVRFQCVDGVDGSRYSLSGGSPTEGGVFPPLCTSIWVLVLKEQQVFELTPRRRLIMFSTILTSPRHL